MYISNWDEFQKAVEELYTTSPERVTTQESNANSHHLPLSTHGALFSYEQTRYVSRFRHSDGELILKVTDDRKVRCHADTFT